MGRDILPRRPSRIITKYSPRSPVAEAYRTLRTNIDHSDLPKPIKVILVTSPRPSEGKTITVANLAIAMSEVGRKTLVIDADMRKPAVHETFELDKFPGLSEILQDYIKWEECLKSSGIKNLSIITSGDIPENPSSLLSSDKMKNIVDDLKNYFDVILIDTSSVLAVTDAQILSGVSDGVLLVTMSEKTDREAAVRSVNLLRSVKAKMLGTVFNSVGQRRKYGYYYYYGRK